MAPAPVAGVAPVYGGEYAAERAYAGPQDYQLGYTPAYTGAPAPVMPVAGGGYYPQEYYQGAPAAGYYPQQYPQYGYNGYGQQPGYVQQPYGRSNDGCLYACLASMCLCCTIDALV